MDKPYVLSLDVGTQSVRAIVFDYQGKMVDMKKIVYDPPYHSPRPGLAEQSVSYYWESLCLACKGLWQKGKVTSGQIAGVAVTSQRGTVVNLDEDRKPLREAILWLDQRRATNLPKLKLLWQTVFKLAGLNKTVQHFQAEAEINWILENEPEIWDRTAHYLLLSGYINYKLTGKPIDSVASQVGYLPFDYKQQRWEKDAGWKWDAVRVKKDSLPELTSSGSQMGCITELSADDTGLFVGTPVIAAASDKACEIAGAGCLTGNHGCVGYGTTATISINSQTYLEPIFLAPAYPSAKPGYFNPEVQIYRGFWMVTWFKEQFAKMEQDIAVEKGVDPEWILEQLAAHVPPGSLGLTLQPYWTPGVRFPGLEAKGSIIGFGSAHKKEHMYRAILEGLAYGLREGKEQIERKSGIRMNKITITGGGSKSDLMMQISADIFNVPTVRPSESETSGLGAAILAAVGAGVYADYDEAVRQMTCEGKTFYPIKENVDIYDRLYKEVYRQMYPKLKNIFKSIRDITGYPI